MISWFVWENKEININTANVLETFSVQNVILETDDDEKSNIHTGKRWQHRQSMPELWQLVLLQKSIRFFQNHMQHMSHMVHKRSVY